MARLSSLQGVTVPNPLPPAARGDAASLRPAQSILTVCHRRGDWPRRRRSGKQTPQQRRPNPGRLCKAITKQAAKAKTLVDNLNLGRQEQARGIEQIAMAITQMEQVTQKSAAIAEESA